MFALSIYIYDREKGKIKDKINPVLGLTFLNRILSDKVENLKMQLLPLA